MTLQEATNEFFKSVPYAKKCGTSEGAVGQCDTISERFKDFLKERGIESSLVIVSGLPDFKDAHGYWIEDLIKGLTIHHYILLVNDIYIDWSYRQFVPGASHPSLFTIEQLKENWDNIAIVE